MCLKHLYLCRLVSFTSQVWNAGRGWKIILWFNSRIMAVIWKFTLLSVWFLVVTDIHLSFIIYFQAQWYCFLKKSNITFFVLDFHLLPSLPLIVQWQIWISSVILFVRILISWPHSLTILYLLCSLLIQDTWDAWCFFLEYSLSQVFPRMTWKDAYLTHSLLCESRCQSKDQISQMTFYYPFNCICKWNLVAWLQAQSGPFIRPLERGHGAPTWARESTSTTPPHIGTLPASRWVAAPPVPHISISTAPICPNFCCLTPFSEAWQKCTVFLWMYLNSLLILASWKNISAYEKPHLA